MRGTAHDGHFAFPFSRSSPHTAQVSNVFSMSSIRIMITQKEPGAQPGSFCFISHGGEEENPAPGSYQAFASVSF